MMFYHRMLLGPVLLLILATQRVSALPQGNVFDKRAPVDQCVATLVALKASAFCSSFIGISDVVQTQTAQSCSIWHCNSLYVVLFAHHCYTDSTVSTELICIIKQPPILVLRLYLQQCQ